MTPEFLKDSSLLNSSAILLLETLVFELGDAMAAIIVATTPINKPMLDEMRKDEIRPMPAPIAHAPIIPIFLDIAKKDNNNVATTIIPTPPTNCSIDSMSRIFRDECTEMKFNQSFFASDTLNGKPFTALLEQMAAIASLHLN